MKSTTMDLRWDRSRLMDIAVCAAAPRPSVRDSLWVSLMSARRSLDSALEDRLMGFPRRPAACRLPWAGMRWRAASDPPVDRNLATWPAEDLAFGALALSALVTLGYCFWQMCLSMA
jgi:hypothetical protein